MTNTTPPQHDEGDAIPKVDGRSDALYEEFVRHFARDNQRIFAFIMALLHNFSDAEEVFQEASLVLWREFSTFDPTRPFLPWAMGVAFNQVRKFRRLRKRDRLLFSEAFYEVLAQDTTAMAEEIDERRQALAHCLDRLENDDRQLVELYYGTKTNARQVADSLHESVHKVYKALNRVRLALMKCIDRRTTLE